MTEVAQTRIDVLARPKPIPTGFHDDRRSVYWDNTIQKDWSNGGDLGTKFAVSQRLEQLGQFKPYHKEWQADRSPLWSVSSAALKSEATSRVNSLAEPRQYHKEFQREKPVVSVVTKAAQNATASQRVEQLAKPKEYRELPVKEDWDWSVWKSEIPENALKCEASARIVSLATPKTLHRDHKEVRSVPWEVPYSAKKALPSIRIQQLARPKSNSTHKEDYDPNWFKVPQGATRSRATPRVEQLAMPLERKVRQKKVVLKS